MGLQNRSAIVGIGRTKVDRDPDSNILLHLARALQAALDDAGLARESIDGIMLNMVPESAAMDKLPELLGLKGIRWSFQGWTHGRVQPTCIGVASWAVLTGQANYVACISTSQTIPELRTASERRRVERLREGGGPHLEAPPYGLLSVGGGAAMAMRKYLNKYGGSVDDLGQIAVSQRSWAQLNPFAYFNDAPLTIDDYIRSPYVVEPLRVLDHCLPGNAAFCFIVAAAERAGDCRKMPVYVSGVQGAASGREHFIFSRSGLGVGQQTEHAYSAPKMEIYERAGLDRSDVDMLGCLDAFSPVVLFTLEEFGFCGEGEALSWVQRGRTAPGGELPVNVGGGGLSDVESYGWGHGFEMVRQIRQEAGPAQLPNVSVCQYACPDRASIIYTRD